MSSICLLRKDFKEYFSKLFLPLLNNGELTDITLIVESKTLEAHKIILSICSPFFKRLISSSECQHPVINIPDRKHYVIKSLLQFMYGGLIEIHDSDFQEFIDTAKELEILGFALKKSDVTKLKCNDHLKVDIERIKETRKEEKKKDDTRKRSHETTRKKSKRLKADNDDLDAGSLDDEGLNLSKYDNMSMQELYRYLKSTPMKEGDPVQVTYFRRARVIYLEFLNDTYIKHFNCKNWTTWRCIWSRLDRDGRRCNASLNVTNDNKIILRTPHNHDPRAKRIGTNNIISTNVYHWSTLGSYNFRSRKQMVKHNTRSNARLA